MIKMLFSTLWWFGFAIAIAMMIGLYFGVGFIEKYVGGLFLLIGVQHMVVLVILGFFAIRQREDNIEIGNRVSTMGYLHTLIGTSVALIMTAKYGSDVIEHVESIIAPIGSSLITSIIGWAFGKEMERDKYRFKMSAQEETNNALENLSKKIIHSASIIEESSKTFATSAKQWESTIDVSSKEINTTRELLESELKETSEYSKKIINESLEILQEQFELLQKSSRDMNRQFETTSKDAGKVFKNSVDTFDSGISRMNDIAKEWDRHIKTMKRFSTHSESAMEQLSHLSRKIIDDMSTISDNLPKAGEMISDLDSFIAKVKDKN